MRRTFIAKFEDREIAVEVEARGAFTWAVRIDGDEKVYDLRSVGPNQVSLLESGQVRDVYLHRSGDAVDCLVASQRFQFSLLSEMKARRLAARLSEDQGGRREIKASMPGKVVDVLVEVGDVVEAKQGILVIEAMKMENEIKSPGAGEVKEIHVQPGEAVEAGELLLVVE